MTRDEKISAIYAEMANKELTFWCKLKFDIGWKKSIYNESDPATEPNYWIIKWECEYEDSVQLFLNYAFWSYAYFRTDCEDEVLTYSDDYEIIWHPVMIWDVIDWIEKKEFDVNKPIPWFWFEEDEEFNDETKLLLIQDYYVDNLISYWDKKRESIESQSEDCIDYIYSLIGK